MNLRRGPRSPGQNFGVLEYHTLKKIFMRSIQIRSGEQALTISNHKY